MEVKDAQTQYYEALWQEQKDFRDWLLQQPAEEILDHSYEDVCCKGRFQIS